MGFGLGLYYFFKGFRQYHRYRVLVDTPSVPIRSMAMGLVQTHGIAKGCEQVYSPVSRTPCYFYRVDIEKWETDSKGRGRWRDYKKDQCGVRFYLEDPTGRVLVDALGAELDLKLNSQQDVIEGSLAMGFDSWSGRKSGSDTPGLWPTESELLQYVRKVTSGMAIPNLAPSSPQEPGAPGLGTPSPASMAKRELELFRQARRRRKAQKRGGLSTLLGFFRMGSGSTLRSGRYRLTEYCVLPEWSYDVTGTCTENPNPRDTNDRNLIVKGENEPTFLISYRNEEEIEGSLRRRATLRVFGGAALSVLCLGILLNEFGWF